jgi:hypothetical protein
MWHNYKILLDPKDNEEQILTLLYVDKETDSACCQEYAKWAEIQKMCIILEMNLGFGSGDKVSFFKDKKPESKNFMQVNRKKTNWYYFKWILCWLRWMHWLSDNN